MFDSVVEIYFCGKNQIESIYDIFNINFPQRYLDIWAPTNQRLDPLRFLH